MVRILAVALAALTVLGLFRERMFDQKIYFWSAEGYLSLGIFLALSVPAALLFPRWLTLAVMVAGAIYGSLAVGPAAILGAAFFLASCYCLGRLLWRGGDDPFCAAALGLAAWVLLFGMLVRFPIHYPWVWWLLLSVPILLGGRPRWRVPQIHPLILLPLTALFLLALKPEASSDGLAMHLVIPARIAQFHRWPFDVTEFAWAVMPMNGDWVFSIAYQLGGEAAARLANFGALCLAAGILARRTPVLVTAAFLSLPMVYSLTSALMVENIWALLLLAAVVALDAGAWAVAAILAGAACGAKFGAILIALPLLLLAVWRSRNPLPLLIGVLCAVQPYADAWIRTGNPVFPFQNHIFKSPFFDASAPFVDMRFQKPLNWRFPYEVNPYSDRYLEGGRGGFGFQWLVFLPLAWLAWRRTTPLERLALGLATLGAILSFKAQTNLRYLYGAMALWTVSFAAVLRAWPWTRWLLGGCAGLNFCFWCVCSWQHKDFLGDLRPTAAARERYKELQAPMRLLLDGLQEPVAFLHGSEVGLLRGRAYVYSWHNAAWQKAVLQAGSAQDLAQLMRDRGVRLWAGPSVAAQAIFPSEHVLELARDFSDVVKSASDRCLYRLADSRRERTPEVLGPGNYNEHNDGAVYLGAWVRDNQFPETTHHTVTYCAGPPCTADFHFNGGAVTLIYTAASNRGQARLWLDGVDRGVLNQHSSETRWQQSYTLEAPSKGPHVLRIEVLKGYVDVDGYTVTMEK